MAEFDVFTCTPALTAEHKPAPKAWDKHLRVDIHCHIQCAAADDLARPFANPMAAPIVKFANDATREVNKAQLAGLAHAMTSLDLRLQVMDRGGIDVQVLSPAPSHYYYWADPDLAIEATRLVNDHITEAVATHPGRLAGLGTIPLQHPALAIEEMHRLAKLGLRGFEVGTSVMGRELSDPSLRPIWAKAEELGMLVFVHPLGFTHGDRMTEHYFINTIGNPLESALAVGYLIHDGVLKDHPGLKICVAHGGGYLPGYIGRMDHAFAARSDCGCGLDNPPSHYLGQLYFDSVVYNARELRYLIDTFGAEHVLMGTDYPYDMSEADPVGHVAAAVQDDAEARAVLGGNAARLLGLDYDQLLSRARQT